MQVGDIYRSTEGWPGHPYLVTIVNEAHDPQTGEVFTAYEKINVTYYNPVSTRVHYNSKGNSTEVLPYNSFENSFTKATDEEILESIEFTEEDRQEWPVCPKCGSRKYAREKRPDGDTKCLDCGHKDKSSNWGVGPRNPEVENEHLHQ